MVRPTRKPAESDFTLVLLSKDPRTSSWNTRRGRVQQGCHDQQEHLARRQISLREVLHSKRVKIV